MRLPKFHVVPHGQTILALVVRWKASEKLRAQLLDVGVDNEDEDRHFRISRLVEHLNAVVNTRLDDNALCYLPTVRSSPDDEGI
jgi:hypothetical protein